MMKPVGVVVALSAPLLLMVGGCTTGSSTSIAQAPIQFTVEAAAPTPAAAAATLERGDYASGVPTYYALAGSAVLPVASAPTLESLGLEAQVAGVGVRAATDPGLDVAAGSVPAAISATSVLSAAPGGATGLTTSATAAVPAAGVAAAALLSPSGGAATLALSPGTGIPAQTLVGATTANPIAGVAAVSGAASAPAGAASADVTATASLATRGSLLAGPTSAATAPSTAIANALLATASLQQQTMKTCLLKPKC